MKAVLAVLGGAVLRQVVAIVMPVMVAGATAATAVAALRRPALRLRRKSLRLAVLAILTMTSLFERM